jgi:hypothetical protein
MWDHPTIDALARHLSGRSVPAPQETAFPTPHGAEPIAIVGLACRFPQTNSPAAFWKLLSEGIDAITEVPNGRWDLSEFYDTPRPPAASPGAGRIQCRGSSTASRRLLCRREWARSDYGHREQRRSSESGVPLYRAGFAICRDGPFAL